MPPATAVRAVQNRLTYAVFSGFKAVATSFGRTIYVLWLEMTGFVFAIFTVISGSALLRQYRAQAWLTDKHRFWATIAFTSVSAWFTLTSFFRARRTRKK
jgi:glycerol-3-phosphate acyltransferase PlsY